MTNGKKFILLLAAGLSFSISCVSYARPNPNQSTFTVEYKRAELANKTATEQLYKRILIAADDVCEYNFLPVYALKTPNRYNHCLRRNVAFFVSKIDHPRLDRAVEHYPKPSSKLIDDIRMEKHPSSRSDLSP